MAAQIAGRYQENDDLSDFLAPEEASQPLETSQEESFPFVDSGFYYTQSTETHFILILSRFLNTKVSVREVLEDGVQVVLEAVVPSVNFLEKVSQKTSLHANMYNFSPRSHELFISSEGTLDTDPTRIEKDSSDPHWLLVVIPLL